MPWDDDGMSFYYTHINKNKRERRNPIFSIAEFIFFYIYFENCLNGLTIYMTMTDKQQI
jgi:hypothetical protein